MAIGALALPACVLRADVGDAERVDAAATADARAPVDASPSDGGPPARDPRIGDRLAYGFDVAWMGDVPDRSGNGFDIHLLGAWTLAADGPRASALVLSGGSGWLPKDPAIGIAPPLTVEAWVRRDADDAADPLFGDKDDAASPRATFHVELAAGGAVRVVTNDACTTDVDVTSATAVVGAGAWHHVAVAWDGAEARFFVDGVQTDARPLVASPCAVAGPAWRIGSDADGAPTLHGAIDDVQVSSYAKTAADVAAAMGFDLGATGGRCGDGVVERLELCDAPAACCRADCTFAADGAACGAGATCAVGACVGQAPPAGGAIAVWEFDDGAGAVVADRSGIAPAIDLVIADPANVTWGPGTLTVDAATVIASAEPATKIVTAAQLTGELTIEAWITPANATQAGPARIATLSADPGHRNVTLGQQQRQFVGRLRTDLTTANGTPATHSPVGDAAARRPAYVVLVRRADGRRELYVDGRLRRAHRVGGSLAAWDAGYRFAIANELTGDRPWLGTFDRVAVYNRAMSAAEVGARYAAGPP